MEQKIEFFVKLMSKNSISDAPSSGEPVRYLKIRKYSAIFGKILVMSGGERSDKVRKRSGEIRRYLVRTGEIGKKAGAR
jgi:hypothetical protein